MFNFDISAKFVMKAGKKKNDREDLLAFIKERNLPITKIESYVTDSGYTLVSGHYKNKTYESLVLVDKGAPFECLILFENDLSRQTITDNLDQLLDSDEIVIFCDEEYKEFYKFLISKYYINFKRGLDLNKSSDFFYLMTVTNMKNTYFKFIIEKILPYYTRSISFSQEKIFIELFKTYSRGPMKQRLAFLAYLNQLLNSNQILDFENTKLANKFLTNIFKVTDKIKMNPNSTSRNEYHLILYYLICLIVNKQIVINLVRKKGQFIKDLNQINKDTNTPNTLKQVISLCITQAMNNSRIIKEMLK